MDKRLQLLIEGARISHTACLYHNKDEPSQPWCRGCEGFVIYTECPVLEAAKELEEEEDDEESS